MSARKGMTRTVFGIVIFLGFLALLVGGLMSDAATIQQGSGLTNQTNVNMTLINTGLGTARLCDYQSDIPVVGGLLWGADCVGDYVGFLMGLASISTDNVFLGVIFLAIVAVIMLVVVRMLRGN